jgi:predicted dehydrogenase
MKTIKWGIIGCGDVTEVKSGPGFQLADNSELVAVMRRNGRLARDYAQRHKVNRWYDDARQLISDPEVDAVYVATPPASHKEYTTMVAEAGKPVYVEKPMALNYSECRDMIATADAAGIPLFVAYYRRALPRFLTIKSMIDNGEIGDVRGVHIVYHSKASKSDLEGKENWRVQPAISGGGYFVDLACHTLDILQYYFGNIISADGNAINQAGLYPAEDLVAGNFIFSSGVYGTGLWCFSAHEHLDRTEIIGSKGKITFATFGNSPVELQTSGGIRYLDLPNPLHIQQPLIQTIVDELNGVGNCPSTGLTAAGTSKVMDRLLS